MKRLIRTFGLVAIGVLAVLAIYLPKTSPVSAQSAPPTVKCVDGTPAPNNDASQCPSAACNHDFFGLKPWYAYLQLKPAPDCSPIINLAGDPNNPDPNRFNAIWLIGLAVFEDILRIAGIVAVAFIIFGGYRYISSQGEPDNTKAALATIINAVIGLAITIIGAAVVSFIGAKLG